jgi:predicted DNA-binding transcriptional regulator AlpA
MHLFRERSVSHANEHHRHTSKKPSAQVPAAKKASAALKAAANKAKLLTALIEANEAYIAEAALVADTLPQHDDDHVHAARGPPVRLLDKNDILSITHVTFPTIWSWMRAGTFPRSRVVGAKSMWRSDEIDAWLANLPTRTLKGDTNTDSGAAA